ncbi:MAG: hypothetical protein V1708_02910 [Candidatus Micrarchaeota archaeon]
MKHLREVNQFNSAPNGREIEHADHIHHTLMTISVHAQAKGIHQLKSSLNKQAEEILGQIRQIREGEAFGSLDQARKRHLDNAVLYADSAKDHVRLLKPLDELESHHAFTDLLKAVSQLHGALLGTVHSLEYAYEKARANQFFRIMQRGQERIASGEATHQWIKEETRTTPRTRFFRKPNLPRPGAARD